MVPRVRNGLENEGMLQRSLSTLCSSPCKADHATLDTCRETS